MFAEIKEVVCESEDRNFQDVMALVNRRKLRTVEVLYGSEDQIEGPRAFAEKRKPVWKGR